MKGVLIIVMLLLCTAVAYAGSISGLDNKDCTEQERVCVHRSCDRWWHGHCIDWDCDAWEDVCEEDINTEINDEDVEIDADTLGGSTAEDLQNYADTRDDIGGGGIGSDTLSRYLTGRSERDYRLWDDYNSYYDFELTRFVTLETLEDLQKRIDLLEARINQCDCSKETEQTKFDAAEITYQRTGQAQSVDGYHCNGIGCVKVTSVLTEQTGIAEGNAQGPDANTLARRGELLALWRHMCEDDKLIQYCKIVEQRKTDWGMQ